MAEKNRSRVVVWTVVGILVVAAVIFLIVARRGTTPGGRNVSTEDVGPFVARMQSQMARERNRVAKRQSRYGSDYAEEFAQIRNHFDNVNAGLAEIQELTDGEEIGAKMKEIKGELGKARDLRKVIGR
ncbi:MAG: hypothetical protein JSU73_13985 [candidate division WOR-3 bacterium]|nr:MAG: hypothetical protein JSU73_13985 [candidate division WOR-3 bacterium]